jgi:uncharacterized protein YacL
MRSMNERKLAIIGAAILCIISGAAGAIVGYGMDGFRLWPDREEIAELSVYGSMIGVPCAIVTAFLLLAAAREKMWLVALVGCFLTFVVGGYYGAKQARDLHEFGARMFRKDNVGR